MLYKSVFYIASIITISVNTSYGAQQALRKALPKFTYILPALASAFSSKFNPAFSKENDTNQAQYKPRLLIDLLPRKAKEIQIEMQLDLKKPCANIILLHGEPGTGKTECARHLAAVGNYEFVPVKTSGLITKFQGSGSEAITEIINNAENLYKTSGKKSFIFFDEIDAIARIGSDQASTKSHADVENALMQLWQYLTQYHGDPRIVFCFATNNLKSLHSAFKDRFKETSIIEFKLPNKKEREDLFRHYFGVHNFSIETTLGIDKLEAEKILQKFVDKSEGLSHRAISLSVESFLHSAFYSSLTNEDIAALAQVTKADLQKLPKEIKQKWPAMSRAERLKAMYTNILHKPLKKQQPTGEQFYKILEDAQAKRGQKRWYHLDYMWLLNTGATITHTISNSLNIYMILTGKGNGHTQNKTEIDPTQQPPAHK